MVVAIAVAHCIAFASFVSVYPDFKTTLSFDFCDTRSSRIQCSGWCIKFKDSIGFKVDRLDERKCCCARRRNVKSKELDSRTDVCIYHDTRANNIGRSCVRNSDCIGMMTLCFRNKCLCVPGYSYIPTDKKCVRYCREYGNTMTVYPGLAIKGHNEDQVSRSVFKSLGSIRSFCADRCLKITKFKCISAEAKGNRCYFSIVGYLDVLENYREQGLSGWTYLMRDCSR